MYTQNPENYSFIIIHPVEAHNLLFFEGTRRSTSSTLTQALPRSPHTLLHRDPAQRGTADIASGVGIGKLLLVGEQNKRAVTAVPLGHRFSCHLLLRWSVRHTPNAVVHRPNLLSSTAALNNSATP